MFLTLGDQWVALLVLSKLVAVYRLADLQQIEKVSHGRTVTMLFEVGRIEVRETLSANLSGRHVLMCVHQCVDAVLAEFVDQQLDFIQVSVVVDAGCHFHSFPHDAQSHEVESPLEHVLNIRICQTVLGIEF